MCCWWYGNRCARWAAVDEWTIYTLHTRTCYCREPWFWMGGGGWEAGCIGYNGPEICNFAYGVLWSHQCAAKFATFLPRDASMLVTRVLCLEAIEHTADIFIRHERVISQSSSSWIEKGRDLHGLPPSYPTVRSNQCTISNRSSEQSKNITDKHKV